MWKGWSRAEINTGGSRVVVMVDDDADDERPLFFVDDVYKQNIILRFAALRNCVYD